MVTLRKEMIVGVICWKLKTHLIEALSATNFHIRHLIWEAT